MGGSIRKEVRLAVALQKLCDDDGKETDPVQSAQILHKFGLLYMGKSPDKISLIQSAAFLNAAIIRQPSNQLFKDDLNKLCIQALQNAGAVRKKYNFELISLILSCDIETMRVYVFKSLKKIQNIPKEVSDEELRTLQEKQVKQVGNVQIIISAFYTSLMRRINSICTEIMGEPPCEYSVTGLGSLARKEVTPFSDFEHIIILEEGVQHLENYEVILEFFRWFSVIFHIVVINLKESILRSVAVRWLNDDSICGGDWFYDKYTPCGIKFDGMQLPACKFPLGRTRETDNKPFTIELIKPVSLMVKYLEVDEDIKNGYHLADILTKSCFVAGCKSVHEKFVEEVKNKTSSKKGFTSKQLVQYLMFHLRDFDVHKCCAKLTIDQKFNIKHIIYRTSTLFVSAVGRIYSIEKFACFEIVLALLQKELITKETAHKLSYMTAVACLTRLKIYMLKNGQNDFFGRQNYHVRDFFSLKDLINIIGERSLFDYFLITSALQSAINSEGLCELRSLRPKLKRRFSILWYLKLFDRLAIEWELYTHNCKPEPLEDDLIIREAVASMFYDQGNYKEALEIFDFINAQTFNNQTLKANVLRAKADCLFMLGHYDVTLEFIKEAKKEFYKFRNMSEDDFALQLFTLCTREGHCKRELGLYADAIRAHFIDLKRIKILSPRLGMFIPTTYSLIAHCYGKQNNPQQALKFARKALEAFQERKDSPAEAIALSFFEMGKYCLQLNLEEQTIEYLRKSGETMKPFYADTSKVQRLMIKND